MIEKLRLKFIIVSMVSIFLVLFTILFFGNLYLYKNINFRNDKILDILTENGGNFPKREERFEKREAKPMNDEFKNNNLASKLFGINFELNEESRFETRFFSVAFNYDGEIINTNTGFVASISHEDAIDLAGNIYKYKKIQGYKNGYRYRVTNFANETLIVFVDSHRDLSTLTLFRLISLAILLISMIATFFIVNIFSKIALKPVEESYNKQKRFITDASHEIKTPLAIIDANTDIIEIENGESEWTKSTKNQVSRLVDLTNSLVSLARMDEDSIAFDMVEFSLSNLIEEEYFNYLPLANIKNKNIKIDIEKNIKYCGNEQYIRQMIGIFLDNAVKYSLENNTILVKLKNNNKKKIITIENKAENIEKNKNYDFLFERFYRMDSSRNSSTGGHGVGLSLAKSIVTMHKGKVVAISDENANLKFIIEL